MQTPLPHPNSRTIDIVTGQVTYEKANEMRQDRENTCGQSAILYEKEPNEFAKLWREESASLTLCLFLTVAVYFIYHLNAM